MKRLTLVTIFVSLILSASSALAEKETYQESIEGLDPMDLSEVDPKVAGILRKYYQYTFGGSLNWDTIESLRIDGELLLKGETYSYVVYRKKPNYVKIVILHDNGSRLILGYDGEDAWQVNTSLQSGAEPVAMPKAEELNFIRDAAMGGNLLYPQLRGKQFEFVGTATIEGDRVYELKTILPDGQVVRSFFDMTSFTELYQITVNNVNQSEELNIHTDFRKVDGIRMPFSTTLKVNGEQVHQLRATSLKINKGVMPWVFSRSHGSNNKIKNEVSETSLNRFINSKPGSSFSIQEADIWSTASGVVGSAFQIESAGSSEDQGPSDVDGSNQEPEESEE